MHVPIYLTPLQDGLVHLTTLTAAACVPDNCCGASLATTRETEQLGSRLLVSSPTKTVNSGRDLLDRRRPSPRQDETASVVDWILGTLVDPSLAPFVCPGGIFRTKHRVHWYGSSCTVIPLPIIHHSSTRFG